MLRRARFASRFSSFSTPSKTSMRPRAYLPYDQIAQWLDAIGPELRAADFVGVVAVLRGGVFPAHCVSFATGLPVFSLRYSRSDRRASWAGELPPPGKLLICEDIAGSGSTLADAVEFVRATHPEHEVLTIVSDEWSRLQPRWSMQRAGIQTVLPWERHDQTPAHKADRREGGTQATAALRPDHEYRFWGVDLDGVMCSDLAPERYAADLSACLAERDTLPLLPLAPTLMPGTHAIVTGRPLQDQARTRQWLARHGFEAIAVHHRDPQQHDASIDAVARHKGSTADRLGCSDFIESCPHQATLIAMHFPHLRVYWWRDGQPVLLSAASASI